MSVIDTTNPLTYLFKVSIYFIRFITQLGVPLRLKSLNKYSKIMSFKSLHQTNDKSAKYIKMHCSLEVRCRSLKYIFLTKLCTLPMLFLGTHSQQVNCSFFFSFFFSGRVASSMQYTYFHCTRLAKALNMRFASLSPRKVTG